MHPRFLGKMMRDATIRLAFRPREIITQFPSRGRKGKSLPTENLVRHGTHLPGALYSTVFRVLNESAFVLDPDINEMSRHLEFFEGPQGGEVLRCVTNKDGQPQMALRWDEHSVTVMADDVLPSTMNTLDVFPWVETLQKHLHPDDGIIISGLFQNGTRYHIYITTCQVAMAEL